MRNEKLKKKYLDKLPTVLREISHEKTAYVVELFLPDEKHFISFTINNRKPLPRKAFLEEVLQFVTWSSVYVTVSHCKDKYENDEGFNSKENDTVFLHCLVDDLDLKL